MIAARRRGTKLGIGERRTVVAGIGVLSLVWGVFNTWELIFRVQGLDQP